MKGGWEVLCGREQAQNREADGGVIAQTELHINYRKKSSFGNSKSVVSFLCQVAKRAAASQPDSVDAQERAEKFRQKYWNKLQTLRQQPL